MSIRGTWMLFALGCEGPEAVVVSCVYASGHQRAVVNLLKDPGPTQSQKSYLETAQEPPPRS